MQEVVCHSLVHDWVTQHGIVHVLLIRTIVFNGIASGAAFITRWHRHILLLIVLDVDSSIFLVLIQLFLMQFAVNMLVSKFKSFVKHVRCSLGHFAIDMNLLNSRLIHEGIICFVVTIDDKMLLVLTSLLIINLDDPRTDHLCLDTHTL